MAEQEVENEKNPLEKKIATFMTSKTKTILAHSLAIDALTIMQANKIYSLAVLDKNEALVGIIRMHDLIESGLI